MDISLKQIHSERAVMQRKLIKEVGNYYQHKGNCSGPHKSFQVQSPMLNQMICPDLCTYLLPTLFIYFIFNKRHFQFNTKVFNYQSIIVKASFEWFPEIKPKSKDKGESLLGLKNIFRHASTDSNHYLASFIPKILIFLDQAKINIYL